MIQSVKSDQLSVMKYHELRNALLIQLQQVKPDDYEEIGSINYSLLTLGLRFDQIKLDEVDRTYLIIKNSFERQEDHIKEQLKHCKRNDRKALEFQLNYFFKLIEHYFAQLEDLFQERQFLEHAKQAYADKLKFKANQRLSEKRFIDYFEYKREELTNRFRSHYLLYTLVGGIGMIVFWRGVWDLTYLIPVVKYPIGSIIVGLALMAITGFIASVGDRSITAAQDKYEN